ncbi:MAG: ATP-dependent DNA helicase RecG [Acholeplasmataceae bacterium]
MEIKLDQVEGIGPQTLRKLRNQNLWSTYDLVLNVPKGYQDFSISKVSDLKHHSKVTIKGSIIGRITDNPYGKVFSSTFDVLYLEQVFHVIIFNRKYLSKQIKEDQEIIIQGIYNLYQQQIVASDIRTKIDESDIKPVYRIKDVSDQLIHQSMKHIFTDQLVQIFEIIPDYLLHKYRLISRYDAYHHIHLPQSFKDIDEATRRLKYEEAFFLELKVVSDQSRLIERKPKSYDITYVKSFIETIPYELTKDQKEAVNDIYRDFKKDHAMFRLIQGDVGSGKTIVALIAIMAVVSMKEQAVFMAPTTILAEQQFMTYQKLAPHLKIALLTQKTPNKKQMLLDINNHVYDVVVGTHALIEDTVNFSKLGLVVIDEQHKFGVETRNQLIKKSHSKDVLYLTATPIPRTLAMMTFGGQNVSIIKEKPKQKEPIETIYVTKDSLTQIYEKINEEIKSKHHVYVVVPAISSNKVDDNIKSVHTLLSHQVKAPIFMLHGQMSKEEQEHQMQAFMHEPSILLATTMIEVGIDISTATVMVIFSAENFGLSQLHQLRGRIGRNELKSTCYLVSEKDDIERLHLLSQIDDGFELANYDLKLRGPGDFIGQEQSGFLKFNFLDIMSDHKLIDIAQNDVYELLKQKDFQKNSKYYYLRNYIKESLKI